MATLTCNYTTNPRKLDKKVPTMALLPTCNVTTLPLPENLVSRKPVSGVKHNKVKSDCQPQLFSGPI
jgi:hypothetical protein